LNEPDRHRVAIEFSVARLDGGDDDEDSVQDPKDGQENKADQDEAKDPGDHVVDEHRDLEVERSIAVRIAALITAGRSSRRGKIRPRLAKAKGVPRSNR
jgi:hypothetical protein